MVQAAAAGTLSKVNMTEAVSGRWAAATRLSVWERLSVSAGNRN